MKQRRLRNGVLFFVLAFAPFAFAHSGHKAIAAKGVRIDEKGLLHLDSTARMAIGVAVVGVEVGTIEQSIQLNARVILPSHRKAFASTRVAGVVRKLLVRPGQRVKAGDVLATIDSLAVEALRARLRQSVIAVDLAEKNLKRARDLGEAVVAGREILELEVERDTRRYDIDTARMKLAAIGVGENRDVSVLAPTDGIVTHIDVVVGQHVEPTQHLFKIHDLHEVWLECEVTENEVAHVVEGQAVLFRAFAVPDRTFRGTVGPMDLSMDRRRAVRRAWVPLSNLDEALLPGMSGIARMIRGRVGRVPVVSAAAIVTNGAERYCFIQTGEGVYRKSNVVLGADQDGLVQVLEGLQVGDLVVTTGNHELSSLFVSGVLTLSEEAMKNIGFAAVEVGSERIEEVLHANARVVLPPGRRGVATTRLAGKIQRIPIRLGQSVKAGQPLAQVQSLDLQNTQWDLLRLRRKWDLVARQLDFVNGLNERGITARKELLRLQSAALEADSRLESYRRSLLIQGMSSEEIDAVIRSRQPLPGVTVRAPIDGRVQEIRVVVGQVVAEGDALFELVDPSKVWVEGSFFEPDLAPLLSASSSRPVRLRTVAYAAREWTGFLSILGQALGREGVLRGWTEITNEDGALLPGMNCMLTVTLARPDEEVIAVPLAAVLTVGRRSYVFVEQGKEFRRVAVSLGRRDTRFAEVLAGAFPGDRVVVSGVNEMNNALSAVR